MKENASRRRRVILWLLTGAFCAWLVLDVFPGHLSRRIAYGKAESLIRAGNYEEAEAQIGRLWGIGQYDREYLRMYCRVYPLYLKGRLQEAAEQYEEQYHGWYYRDEMTVWNQPWLDWEAVSKIRAEVSRQQKEKEKREEAERQARAEQAEKDYQEKVRSSEMPFLGMREEDVWKTRLGWYYGKIWSKNEYYWYKDRRYTDPNRVGMRPVNHYDFVKNGELVLEVWCTNGKVDELARYENGRIYYSWSYRLTEEVYERTYRETWYPKGFWSSPKNSGSSAGTGKKKTYADDYANEEDFYEDYADEFEDLDEAMDYYQDHYQ